MNWVTFSVDMFETVYCFDQTGVWKLHYEAKIRERISRLQRWSNREKLGMKIGWRWEYGNSQLCL